jgi:homoserine O-acetyltransferase
MSLQSFTYTGVFELENGSKIKDLQIGYNTYGTLNKNRDNVVWVCHALTANSDVFDWWKGLFRRA